MDNPYHIKKKKSPLFTGVEGGLSSLQTNPVKAQQGRRMACFSQLSSPVPASTPASKHTGGGPVGITLGLNCPVAVVNVQAAISAAAGK